LQLARPPPIHPLLGSGVGKRGPTALVTKGEGGGALGGVRDLGFGMK
jgi:hypothetical protein